MGGAEGGAGALIPEGPGASEEGWRCVPEREEREKMLSVTSTEMSFQGEHPLHACSQNAAIVQEVQLVFSRQPQTGTLS